MTVVLLGLDAALTLLAGVCLVGLIGTPLRLLERVLIAVVAGVITCSAATYGLALLIGLNVASVLLAPLLVGGIAFAAGFAWGDPMRHWNDSWRRAIGEWRERPPYLLFGFTGALIVVFGLLFAHTMFISNGALEAGYPTVWADWAQHLSTEASFADSANLPPQNPLFSGAPLFYPFLSDFHSATLVVLGMAPATALALPSAGFALVAALLVVCLTQRYGAGPGAGMVAAVICFLGGGLGFIGVFGDACTSHGFSAAQCTLQNLAQHPSGALSIVGWTLHDVPGVIAAQPRAYDGLLTAAAQQPLPNMQWYTPLFAWWLPQRAILYGFSAAVAVLILVRAALSSPRREWAAFGVAGLLVGLMALVHVQTLIVLIIMLALLAAVHVRRGWLALAGTAVVLAAPRLVQLLQAPRGSAALGNAYPWLEPGWMAYGGGTSATAPANVAVAVVQAAGQVLSPRWWGFWLLNLGVAVPLCAVLLIVLALRLAPRARERLATVRGPSLPRPLLELVAAGLLVFAACNLVVFQSWDWDNTKLFLYWYLVVGIVAGVLATHAWRSRWVRAGAILLPVSMVLTGAIVLLRLLPWTPAAYSVAGPYVVASADERTLAAVVAARTATQAVFLTLGRPNDPVLTLTGRPALMGYSGWLWSYGIDYKQRLDDEVTMYAGCSGGAAAPCDVRPLLRRYGVDYVEIDDRTADPGAVTSSIGAWWSAQGFPVVARSDHIIVYDVRAG